jgi:hypothetical protein
LHLLSFGRRRETLSGHSERSKIALIMRALRAIGRFLNAFAAAPTSGDDVTALLLTDSLKDEPKRPSPVLLLLISLIPLLIFLLLVIALT